MKREYRRRVKQASQPVTPEGANPTTELVIGQSYGLEVPYTVPVPTLGALPVEAVDPGVIPASPTIEETGVPPISGNRSFRTSGDILTQALERAGLAWEDGRSPSPEKDVDQEERDRIRFIEEPDADPLSLTSGQEELGEGEQDGLRFSELEELPTGGSSTPNLQDLEPSASGDESFVSVPDEFGAGCTRQMLGDSQETQLSPPSSPRAPRLPRISAPFTHAAASFGTEFRGGQASENPLNPEHAVRVQNSSPIPDPEQSSLFFIPQEFKGSVLIEPASAGIAQDGREWRLAEDHLLSVSTGKMGQKEWKFLRAFESEGVFYAVTLPYESLEERWMSGRRLVALQPSALKIPAARRAFSSLSIPPHPGNHEAEARRKRILAFADGQGQSYSRALGWSGITEDRGGVLVKELPLEMREVLDGSRPARASSPPASFNFEGPKDSFPEGFLKAAYDNHDESLNGYLERSASLGIPLLQQAYNPGALQHARKSMATLGRSLQCSLAITNLADHLGSSGQGEHLSRRQLMELVQVLGTLGTEAALPIVPEFERQVTLFKEEKSRLREEIIADIKQHEVQAILREAPLLSEGLWPRTSFLEAEKVARGSPQVPDRSVEGSSISLKRSAVKTTGHPLKKRLRPNLPPNPTYKAASRRRLFPIAE